MANIYRVRYDRLPKSESQVKTNVYSEGHFREIDLVAASEDEAIKIADRVHAKQFAEEVETPEVAEGDVVVEIGQATPVDPINACTNYKLQGVTLLRKGV